MKKLYIDITQSYDWKGRVTGIIRVMDEISIRFSADPKQKPMFVVWNEFDAEFHEVDFETSFKKRLQKSPESDERAHEVSVENRQLVLRKIALAMPLSRTIYKYGKPLVPQRKSTSSPVRPQVMFEKGSILFMPHGGTWESDAYAEKIISLKHKQGVLLAPILYDLCPVLTPQFCSEGIRIIFDKYMRRVLPQADLTLAISENTAKDARSWITEVSAGKKMNMATFRLGDEIGKGNISPLAKGQAPDRFILCVGTIEARKNHASLYYAYKLAVQQGLDLPPVVIVGRKGWLSEDIYEIITNDPYIKDKFIFLHDVADDELNWLYSKALFSVYPSFYEGWGLPIAESLLRGVPCVASNTSSMPEIAGDLVDYFSPYSSQEIMGVINNLASDMKRLNKRKQDIETRFVATSWDQTYDEVVTLLERL